MTQVADAIACLKTSTPTKTLTPTRLTVNTTPSIVTIRQAFTISGRLTNATGGALIPGKIIQLQKNVSGTWTDVSGEENTTSARGSYSISVSEGTVGIYEYRANYTGNATYAGSHSASVFVTVQQPTQLTAAANPATVATGQTFTIYGSLNAANGTLISGETIQLQKNVSGTWTDVSGKKSTTSTGGSYSISVSEGTVGIYEYPDELRWTRNLCWQPQRFCLRDYQAANASHCCRKPGHRCHRPDFHHLWLSYCY